MTPRERWRAVLDRRKPDRVPTDYWATPEVTSRLKRELGCQDDWTLWQRLPTDKLVQLSPRYVGPADRSSSANIWGVRFRQVSYADGAGVYQEVCSHPLAHVTDPRQLDGYRWPSPDWFDFSDLPDRVDQVLRRGHPVAVGHYEPFLLYCQLRGMEQAMLDLAERPELVEAVLERIFHFHYAMNLRAFESVGPGRIDVTYVAEDLGTQQSLLMGQAMVRRFLMPRMQRMIELAHQFGIRAFHHSDGAIRPLIAGMIAIGIDVLNPIQWRCAGMDRAALKRDFGDQLVFHGAMDNQQTLPFGTPQQVRHEVIENLQILGAGGGYILAPCHNLQPITPTQNILTMYAAAAGEGRL